MRKKPKIRKIRHLKTRTGDNFSLTISKTAAEKFSGCMLVENVLTDGIFFTSGCEPVKEFHIKTHRIHFEKIK